MLLSAGGIFKRGTNTLEMVTQCGLRVEGLLSCNWERIPTSDLTHLSASSVTANVTLSGISDGDHIMARMYATNGAGLAAAWMTDPISFDSTPPSEAIALRQCGTGTFNSSAAAPAPVFYQPHTTSLQLCWAGGFADETSGVAAIEWSLNRWGASAAGPWGMLGGNWAQGKHAASGTWAYVASGEVAVLATAATSPLQLLSSGALSCTNCLSHPNVYDLQARACNRAGLCTSWSSNWFGVYTTTPDASAASVNFCVPPMSSCSVGAHSAPTSLARYQDDGFRVRVGWRGFADGAGLERCIIVLTNAATGEVLYDEAHTCTSSPDELMIQGLALRAGDSYNASVTVTNVAGATSASVSSGLLIVDRSAPNMAGVVVYDVANDASQLNHPFTRSEVDMLGAAPATSRRAR